MGQRVRLLRPRVGQGARQPEEALRYRSHRLDRVDESTAQGARAGRAEEIASPSGNFWPDTGRLRPLANVQASSRADAHGNAPAAERTRERAEASWDASAARADAGFAQIHLQDAIPIAHDECGTAVRTGGGATVRIVDVAGVHVAEPVFERDVTGSSQRRGWCWRDVQHLVV